MRRLAVVPWMVAHVAGGIVLGGAIAGCGTAAAYRHEIRTRVADWLIDVALAHHDTRTR